MTDEAEINPGGHKMEQISRTEHSVRNTTIAFAAQSAAILMGFVTRVVFTRTLSEGYVGINGLFTDILNILSLSELGVGTAITYALYGPIAKKDIQKQQVLMRLFKNFYRLTAAVVLIVGLMLIPFLDVLMKDRPDVDHLILIYLLYLLNSVVSYLLIYKRTLIDACQLNYLTVLYHKGFLILQDICQIIILLVTGNFILFLCAAILCTFMGNVMMSRKADQLFPFLREKCKAKLCDTEKKEIGNNVKAMLMHKIGNVAVNNTDNLLISSLVGVISAGIYSNYYLVIGSIRQILDQAFQGIAASVGNLGVTENSEKKNRIFLQTFFIGQWMYGIAGICLLEMLNPFIEMAFGRKYLFPEKIVLILCINFFITGTRKAVLIFKESMGLFWYDRYKAIVEAVLNLVISIVLAMKLGVAGIFLGTFMSTVLTSLWIEPYVLYKHSFHKYPMRFFARYACNMLIMAFVWWCTHYCCMLVSAGPLLNLLFRFLVCMSIPNLLLWLIYRKTSEWQDTVLVLERMHQKLEKKTGIRVS